MHDNNVDIIKLPNICSGQGQSCVHSVLTSRFPVWMHVYNVDIIMLIFAVDTVSPVFTTYHCTSGDIPFCMHDNNMYIIMLPNICSGQVQSCVHHVLTSRFPVCMQDYNVDIIKLPNICSGQSQCCVHHVLTSRFAVCTHYHNVDIIMLSNICSGHGQCCVHRVLTSRFAGRQ